MSLVLHAFPHSPRSFKVMAVANQLGLDYQLRVVDLTKGEQRRPELVALNPNARVPVLEDDGFVLWESDAIMQYLAAKNPASGLLPMDERGRADVMRWLFWGCAHWDPTGAIFIYENVVKPLVNLGAPDPAEIAKAEPRYVALAGVLDAHLKNRRFLCGDKPTIADFSIASPLNHSRDAKLPIAPYAEIRRWYGEMAALPGWRKTAESLMPRAA
jgi:glutathione S-transferase